MALVPIGRTLALAACIASFSLAIVGCTIRTKTPTYQSVSSSRIVFIYGIAVGAYVGDPIQWWSQGSGLLYLARYSTVDARLTVGAGYWVRTSEVTPQFFSIFSVAPSLGRLFDATDRQASVRPAVIADSLWRSQFASSRDVIGQSVVLAGIWCRIIGVLPPAFRSPNESEIWVLSRTNDEFWSERNTADVTSPAIERRAGWVGLMGQGVSAGALEKELLATLTRTNQTLSPSTNISYGDSITVVPFENMIVRGR